MAQSLLSQLSKLCLKYNYHFAIDSGRGYENNSEETMISLFRNEIQVYGLYMETPNRAIRESIGWIKEKNEKCR